MPGLNGTGPEGKGPKTGRELGECNGSKKENIIDRLGKGLGLRRKSGGGKGRGKRLQSN